MRAYELMVIFNPTVDERTVAPSMEKLLTLVTDNNGTVESVDVWGKRRLAYEIQKQSEGIYVLVNMTTTSPVALEINRQLTLNESVMRTKLLRNDA
ncbi:30S ribosomal protein S6 [Gleimia sp. 6138-11-ORH1]|uniref:30S ribosomal protein S6 n=1 Tax=Gleimia sp. 6138-11-ORH1 TaxID=2973937 RepID=UPI00216902B4|nr:30S ribosomal protein S6 [Gleimia sp. 6138-11-ORH1]MCS4485154.1 30S ribosomal protein S6 [Gleimia sp. 6138-11-ORH1]